MKQKIKTYFNWSSGKDAALALYHLQRDGRFAVEKLLTSVNGYHNRVSMHGLRRQLLQNQTRRMGIPLSTVELPEEPTMKIYNNMMGHAIGKMKEEGYTHCGFGDIFLEDIKAYREEQLKPFGISSSFPLWKKCTRGLVRDFITLGFRAIVLCVNSELLDVSFLGREVDEMFVDDLPQHVDPCGENGEFHTFCFDGPIFNGAVKFEKGEKIFKEYSISPDTNGITKSIKFWFLDLIPMDI